MAKFLKLTQNCTGRRTFINIDLVSEICDGRDGCTFLGMAYFDNQEEEEAYKIVRESPEEIMRMLEE